MVCTLLAGVNVVAFAADGDLDDTISVQKFYFDATKGGNGEHIYTVDEDEISWYKSLPSWNDEGEAWKAPLFSEDPVYRVANYNTGEHLWITDKGYVDYLVGLGWTQEQGIAFYSDENMGVPVYRLWNGTDGVGSHHFTTNEEEIAWLVSTGWTNEGPQFYGVDKEEPQDLEILSAEQTGANTIEFTVSRALTLTDEVALLNGTTEQEMTYDVSEDGKTVEITSVAKLSDATYTVAVTPEEALLPATEDVDCEAEKLAGVMFGPGLAFVSNTNFYTVATSLNGANQWGEEFNLSSGTMTVYPGVAAVPDGQTATDNKNVAPGFTTGYSAEKNQYVLAKSDTIPFKVGDTVTMTAVYNDGNGNVIQETDELPVLNVPQVSSMEFGDLATTSPKLVGQRVTLKNFQTDSYYFPVEAYDQYGNKLDKDSLNYALGTSMLFVNPTPANSTFGGFDGFDELEDGTVILKLASSGAKQMPGKGTITVSGIGGLSTSVEYEVEDNPYIASLNMIGLGTVIENVPAKFGLYAVDQYGEVFDLYGTTITQTDAKTLTFTKSVNGLSGQKASIKVNNGTLAYAKQSSTGQVAFMYTDTSGAKNDVFTLTTSVPTVSTVPVTIKEAGTPASIKSELKSTSPMDDTRLVRDASEKGTANLDLQATSGLVIVDSNGMEMTGAGLTYTNDPATDLNKDKYGYGIKYVEAESGSTINVTNALVSGIDRNATFKVSLYYKDKAGTVKTLDTEEFKIKFTSGNYDDFMAVWADNYDVLYSGSQANGNAETQHVKVGGKGQSKVLLVYGTDEYGLTALLPTTQWSLSYGSNKVQNAAINGLGQGVAYKDSERKKYDPTDPATLVEGEIEFSIWADSSDDDTVQEIVATLTTEYSNITPKAQYWAWMTTDLTTGLPVVADDTIQVTPATSTFVAEAQATNTLAIQNAGFGNYYSYSLAAVDQYGLPLAGVITYSLDGGAAKASTAAAPDITTWVAGDTHTMVATCSGLSDKTITIVVPN